MSQQETPPPKKGENQPARIEAERARRRAAAAANDNDTKGWPLAPFPPGADTTLW